MMEQSVIGFPYDVRRVVSVNQDFSWDFDDADPSEVFELVEKLGEGAFGSVHRAIIRETGTMLESLLIFLCVSVCIGSARWWCGM